MALWQFDFMIIPSERSTDHYNEDELISWRDRDIDISRDMISDLENTFPIEKSWNSKAIQYGEIDSTCVEILLEENQIEDIRCRLDLRNLKKVELEQIIEMISVINGAIFYEHRIYKADINEFLTLIKNSDSARFCMNPMEYFQTYLDNDEQTN